MAANPRGGEGSSKGSRYIPERLVGPGVIEQNGYVDQSKSKLRTGQVVPVPSSDGPVINTLTLATVTALNAAVPGTILRIIPSGIANLTSSESTPVATDFIFKSSAANDITTDNVGFLINFHSLNDPFYVVVPPLATHVRTPTGFGNAVLAVEVILDN